MLWGIECDAWVVNKTLRTVCRTTCNAIRISHTVLANSTSCICHSSLLLEFSNDFPVHSVSWHWRIIRVWMFVMITATCSPIRKFSTFSVIPFTNQPHKTNNTSIISHHAWRSTQQRPANVRNMIIRTLCRQLKQPPHDWSRKVVGSTNRKKPHNNEWIATHFFLPIRPSSCRRCRNGRTRMASRSPHGFGSIRSIR